MAGTVDLLLVRWGEHVLAVAGESFSEVAEAPKPRHAAAEAAAATPVLFDRAGLGAQPVGGDAVVVSVRPPGDGPIERFVMPRPFGLATVPLADLEPVPALVARLWRVRGAAGVWRQDGAPVLVFDPAAVARSRGGAA